MWTLACKTLAAIKTKQIIYMDRNLQMQSFHGSYLIYFNLSASNTRPVIGIQYYYYPQKYRTTNLRPKRAT